jgi:hypothetical protein
MSTVTCLPWFATATHFVVLAASTSGMGVMMPMPVPPELSGLVVHGVERPPAPLAALAPAFAAAPVVPAAPPVVSSSEIPLLGGAVALHAVTAAIADVRQNMR